MLSANACKSHGPLDAASCPIGEVPRNQFPTPSYRLSRTHLHASEIKWDCDALCFGLDPTCSPPTFKTSTTTSRTQLKQQLMREQLQEQDRKEAERKPSPASASAAVTPAAPINTPQSAAVAAAPVELPPQVLEVSENNNIFTNLWCMQLFVHANFYPKNKWIKFEGCHQLSSQKELAENTESWPDQRKLWALFYRMFYSYYII